MYFKKPSAPKDVQRKGIYFKCLFSNTDGSSPESPKLNFVTSLHENPLMRKVF